MKNSTSFRSKTSFQFVILLVSIIVSFSGCSQDNVLNLDDSLLSKKESDANRGDCFDRFRQVLAENNNLANMVEQLNKVADRSPFLLTRSDQAVAPLPDDFSYPEEINSEALALLTRLDFSDEEIETLTGERKKVSSLNKEEKLSLALLAYSVDNYIHSNEFSTFSHVGISPFEVPSTRAITIMGTLACLGEVAGITGGIAAIGNLVKGVVGKAAIRELVIFIGLKIGFRTVSGIGLLLITAELTYCIYEKSNQHNCEITVPVPDWWSPNCGIPLSVANELPIIVNDYNGNVVYSDISLDAIGKQTAVFRRLNFAVPSEPGTATTGD